MRRALESWEKNLLAIVEGGQPEATVATLCVAGE